MTYAKQSTAKTFLVGPILDTDGAAKTDEVVASIKVTKNGTVGAVDAQDTLTHNHTGHYVFVSDGGDFDTLGEVEFTLNSGTNAMGPVKFQVLPANVYDSLVSGSDTLDVQTTGIANDAITAAAIANGAIDAATFAADVDAEARSWLGMATNNLDTQLSAISGYVDCLPATWVTVPTAAQVSTQVASDLASAHGAGSWVTAAGFSTHSAADVVTAMGTGTFLTAVPWNAAWDAEVQSECDDAITANTLIKRIMPAVAGTVSGAGTGTEVFLYGGVTMTVTVDANGNRSVIGWS